MKIAKQILSAILCASLLSSCTMTTFATQVNQIEPDPNIINDPCPWDKRNKYGQYIELNCQKSLLAREIKKDPILFQKHEKLGPEGKDTLYFFSYKSIATFIDEFSRELNKANNKLIAHEILKKSAEKVRFLFGLSPAESEEVISILYESLTGNNKDKLPKAIKALTENKKIDAKSIGFWSVVGAVGGGAAVAILFPVAGAVGAIGAKVIATVKIIVGSIVGAEATGYGRATIISNKHLKESRKQKIIIDNCVSAISQILSNLKYKFWKSGDTIYINFNNDESSNYATVSFSKVGLQYTPEDLIEIEKSFENSKLNLEQLLNKYEEQ